MSTQIPRCHFIKVNGVQCGSPALRGQIHCYFHSQWLEQHGGGNMEIVHGASRLPLSLPPLVDANSIQIALMHIIRLIVSGQIDTKQAGLILYALQTASANLSRINFEPSWRKVVVDPASVGNVPVEQW